MAGEYMQVDETAIRYLEPGYGRSRQGYLRTSSNPHGDVVFDWHTIARRDARDVRIIGAHIIQSAIRRIIIDDDDFNWPATKLGRDGTQTCANLRARIVRYRDDLEYRGLIHGSRRVAESDPCRHGVILLRSASVLTVPLEGGPRR